MDKNSITGLVLITLILIGFWFINKPSSDEIEAIRQQRDSLQRVEMLQQQELDAAARQAAEQAPVELSPDEALADDTVRNDRNQQIYGHMAPFVEGEQQFYTVENNKVRIVFSNRGGRIYSVELKEYETHLGEPLILFDGEGNKFGFTFTHNTRVFNTNDLYFDAKLQNDSSIVFELGTDVGESLQFSYVLPPDEYMTQFKLNTNNLNNLMATPRGSIDINWYVEMPAFEKSRTHEQQYSGLYYKYHLDEVDC
ncbi:YidC/Oxa1 family insertase periplasmic-domain containing protein [Geofilum rubicundum]|uniref:Membrane protein insertase YidC n=1 Tax=Geofilum rubicundum JCM 15548 TaxID=1236989 RepID=A0A0E9M278_9BACT|nr:YidC/Oxa1 family insertase periplasmic-domain containing protein [Geofilum rubicundum]GAO31230.1 inner membrane protein translocase component YidC, long form [Geofilum rubicundum JCM 15548]